jgi:hypothetical protein
MSKILSAVKYSPYVIIVLLFASLSFWQWRAHVASDELLKTKTTELQAANLAIGKAQTEITTQKKLQAEALAELDQQLQDTIKKHNALITMYSDLEASYKVSVKNGDSLVGVIEELKKATSIADLPVAQLFYKKPDGTLAEIKTLTWTWKDFRIDLAGSTTTDGLNPDSTIKIKHIVSYNMHMRFRSQFIEAKLPNGVPTHYAKLFELDPAGKDIGELTLDSFVVTKAEELSVQNHWWSPHLDLGIGFGGNKDGFSWLAEIGFSVSSRGATKDDSTWRFFRIGTGITSQKQYSMTFAPVSFNIGKHIPFTSNIWIHPYAGYNFGNNSAQGGLGLSVVF